jgi:hypothetical protein
MLLFLLQETVTVTRNTRHDATPLLVIITIISLTSVISSLGHHQRLPPPVSLSRSCCVWFCVVTPETKTKRLDQKREQLFRILALVCCHPSTQMSKRGDILVDGIFQPRSILSLTLMCDAVNLDPKNPLLVAIVGPGPCILNVELAPLGVKQPRPTRDQLVTMVNCALESARGSDATRLIQSASKGIAAVELVATYFFWSMESPFPAYRYITDPLNVSGARSKESLEQQLPLIKLLCIAHRSIPRNSTLWSVLLCASCCLYPFIAPTVTPPLQA